MAQHLKSPKSPERAVPRRRKRGAPPAVNVVGIGASAGGLEAIEQLLAGVPACTRFAFIVVQHLDPNRTGALPELLQHATALSVEEACDGKPVRAGAVYVIPPGKNLALDGDRLVVSKPIAARGLRLPIDFLFNSLATQRGAAAIGVVLSGMGSDGTAGLRAIRVAGGLTLVQSPDDARFQDMPRSAIAAGVAQVVAPAAELAARLLQPERPVPVADAIAAAEADLTIEDEQALADILVRVHTTTHHDFSEYKRSSILRRIERRMAERRLHSMAAYGALLAREPAEAHQLVKALLIGVTSFFRDPGVWASLADTVLPMFLATLGPGEPLRAWVPGCSSGEEAYSLGILLLEAMQRTGQGAQREIRIFATDIDVEAIEFARRGLYPPTIGANVSADRLRRYFVVEGQQYRVRKQLRELLVFAVHDVVEDPPFTKLSLVSCRNLLIYMTPELQRKLIRVFHYSLLPHGLLLIGGSESIGSEDSMFAPVDAVQHLYHRLLATAARGGKAALPLPATPRRANVATAPPVHAPRDTRAVDQELVRLLLPAALVVNGDGDILQVMGRSGRYLEPATGKASLNVHAMARPRVRAAVAEALRKVTRRRVRAASATGMVTGSARTVVKVTARRLATPPALRGQILLAFEDQAVRQTVSSGSRSQRALQRALQRADAEVAALRLESRTSREELSAANEELQSINEELQSSNEELTTSTEEAQSINEELQSVNAELQARFQVLTLANSDLRNLLDNTDIATVFLDGGLNVRRFTARMARLVRLIPGDVGRPLTDIKSDLVYPDLEDDVREVLGTLTPSEKQVTTADGRWYTVRIVPYRTLDNAVDGAVITFNDISMLKQLELRLQHLGEERREP